MTAEESCGLAVKYSPCKSVADSLAPKGRGNATPQMQTLASGGKPLKATAE